MLNILYIQKSKLIHRHRLTRVCYCVITDHIVTSYRQGTECSRILPGKQGPDCKIPKVMLLRDHHCSADAVKQCPTDPSAVPCITKF